MQVRKVNKSPVTLVLGWAGPASRYCGAVWWLSVTVSTCIAYLRTSATCSTSLCITAPALLHERDSTCLLTPALLTQAPAYLLTAAQARDDQAAARLRHRRAGLDRTLALALALSLTLSLTLTVTLGLALTPNPNPKQASWARHPRR